MKILIAAAGILIALLNALLLVDIPDYTLLLIVATILLGIAITVMAFSIKKAPPARVAAAPAVIPPPPAAPTQSAENELITLLGLLQEKGRFVDFLMEDVTAYDDAQVGSVARVVHQGCREVVSQHFDIQPIAAVSEGAQITVPAGFSPSEYRLVGKIGGQAPFTGVLVHKGWKSVSVKLPRVVKSGDALPSIAPAEVELK